MTHLQDHFSSIANQYALARIGYPEELYQFLFAQCAGHDLAWDCATGSGQAALGLVRKFSSVIATDISRELLALAPPHTCISYRAASAENSGIEANAVDLIAVAQALHWLDLERFWLEAMRVLKKDGVLAFWGYNWPIVGHGVDRVLDDFRSAVSPFWPTRSAILHGCYRSVHPPFPEIACPSFEASAQWDLDDYLSHLRSWSATRYYHERTGEDVVEKFTRTFRNAWKGSGQLSVHWPLVVRVFRKE